MTDAPENEVNEVDEKTPVQKLLDLIAQRDALTVQVDTDMAALKLDAKSLKAIVKGQEKLAAAKKTLDALMGNA